MTDKITAMLPARKLVQTLSNDGGYITGECLACGVIGWSNANGSYHGLGHAHGIPKENKLVHEADCPVGEYIKEKQNATR